MKVWGVTEEDIRNAAKACGVAIFSDWSGNGIRKDGRALNFRLGLGTERVAEGRYTSEDGKRREYPRLWQRASASPFENGFSWQGETSASEPRRVASVCWHGHYAFMRYLLTIRPEARIKTAFADYRGIGRFLSEAPYTGERNVGAPIYPVAMEDACFCRHYDREDTDVLDTSADEWGRAFVQDRPNYQEARARFERLDADTLTYTSPFTGAKTIHVRVKP